MRLAPVAISACMLGMRTAYDGFGRLDLASLAKLKGRPLLPVCPEVLGGLSIPRIPAEIQADGLTIQNREGRDVTARFRAGALATLHLCQENGIRQAHLKDGSPSCGHTWIYDGSFHNRKISGQGLTCGLLSENGIEIGG